MSLLRLLECGVQFICRAATPVGETPLRDVHTPLQSGVVRIDGRNGKKALAFGYSHRNQKESKQTGSWS